MLSIGIIGIMAVLFVVGVYGAKRWSSSTVNGLIAASVIPMVIGTGLLFFIRTDDSTGSPHAAVDSGVGEGVPRSPQPTSDATPIGKMTGMTAVDGLFGDPDPPRIVRHHVSAETFHSQHRVVALQDPPADDHGIRVLVSDDSVAPTDKVLLRCGQRQAVVIQKGKVSCVQLRALRDKLAKPRRSAMTSGTTMMISPAMFLTAAPPTKPLKDQYAEVFYFLFLVLGVLGKFYWDFSEERASGKSVQFDAHAVVASFVIACLVYYSIQQGIENEASTLTMRGAMFAFNNGFMWQTIIKSMRKTQEPATTG